MSIVTSSFNSSIDETKLAPGLRLEVDVRVSITDPRTGTTVPLGASSDSGKWVPQDFNVSAALDRSMREALAAWLTHSDILGNSIIEDPEGAIAAVAETRQRCLLLAEQQQSKTETAVLVQPAEK